VKLSKDHSVIGFLEESGRLSEEDAMRHPRRNEITKALGFEENISTINDFIEKGESPFLPGDMILVCSDGLSDMISSNTISLILQKKTSLAERARELVAAANDAGGNDNITAVIVQNYNPPTPKVALKPLERKTTTEKNQSSASNHSNEEPPVKKGRRSRSLIVLLTLLSLGILAVLAFKMNAVEKVATSSVLKTNIVKPGNQNLDLLMLSLNDSTRVYSLNPGTTLLNLAAPLLIGKDSFCIKGNAVTINSDSNYKGPAIIISNKAKHIVLDSIVFKNFDVAVVVQKNNIELRNVRFINCRVPLQYQIPLPDTILSGRFKDSIFIPVSNFKKH
jgi:hypothetical protein